MRLGFKRPLTFEDLWRLPRPMLCKNILPKIKKLLEIQTENDFNCDLESKQAFQNLLENQIERTHSKVNSIF